MYTRSFLFGWFIQLLIVFSLSFSPAVLLPRTPSMKRKFVNVEKANSLQQYESTFHEGAENKKMKIDDLSTIIDCSIGENCSLYGNNSSRTLRPRKAKVTTQPKKRSKRLATVKSNQQSNSKSIGFKHDFIPPKEVVNSTYEVSENHSTRKKSPENIISHSTKVQPKVFALIESMKMTPHYTTPNVGSKNGAKVVNGGKLYNDIKVNINFEDVNNTLFADTDVAIQNKKDRSVNYVFIFTVCFVFSVFYVYYVCSCVWCLRMCMWECMWCVHMCMWCMCVLVHVVYVYVYVCACGVCVCMWCMCVHVVYVCACGVCVCMWCMCVHVVYVCAVVCACGVCCVHVVCVCACAFGVCVCLCMWCMCVLVHVVYVCACACGVCVCLCMWCMCVLVHVVYVCACACGVCVCLCMWCMCVLVHVVYVCACACACGVCACACGVCVCMCMWCVCVHVHVVYVCACACGVCVCLCMWCMCVLVHVVYVCDCACGVCVCLCKVV